MWKVLFASARSDALLSIRFVPMLSSTALYVVCAKLTAVIDTGPDDESLGKVANSMALFAGRRGKKSYANRRYCFDTVITQILLGSNRMFRTMMLLKLFVVIYLADDEAVTH